MRNQQYEKKLQEWCNIMFNGKRLSFEIPVNSRSGLSLKYPTIVVMLRYTIADKVTQRYILQRNTT